MSSNLSLEGGAERLMMIKRREVELSTRAGSKCPLGLSSLYTYPTHMSSLDASKGAVVFTWNPDCLDKSVTSLDLSLYASSLETPVIKVWTKIPASQGSYTAELLPKWWNASPDISLQLTLSDSSLPSFLSSIPAGPVFEVTYPKEKLVVVQGGQTQAAAAADTAKPDSVYSIASLFKHGLNAGSIFAAVFFPIVIVLSGVFVYIRFARAKQSKKRQRWSRAVDNRMSVISTSWQPGTSSSGGIDNRKSIADSANRRETLHSGHHDREMSMSNTASFARPQTSVFLGSEQQRISRVSFAHAGTPNDRVSFAEGGGSPGGRGTSGYFGSRAESQYGGGQAGVGAGGGGGGQKMARPSISIYSATQDNQHNNNNAAAQGKKESLDMIISPDQVGGPWVLGEDDERDNVAPLPSAHRAPVPTLSPFPNGPPIATASPDDMLRNYASGGLTPGAGARRIPTVTTPGGNNPSRSSMVGDVQGEEQEKDMGSVGGYFGKH